MDERSELVELNGVEMSKRIWLICYPHAGDVCWTSDPADDADEYETVEYVRADQVAAITALNKGASHGEGMERLRNMIASYFDSEDAEYTPDEIRAGSADHCIVKALALTPSEQGSGLDCEFVRLLLAKIDAFSIGRSK